MIIISTLVTIAIILIKIKMVVIVAIVVKNGITLALVVVIISRLIISRLLLLAITRILTTVVAFIKPVDGRQTLDKCLFLKQTWRPQNFCIALYCFENYFFEVQIGSVTVVFLFLTESVNSIVSLMSFFNVPIFVVYTKTNG